MFRENVLVDDQIIARISGSFVPIAMDIQTAFDADSAEARLLRPSIRPGKAGGLSNEHDQGIWILAPNGDVLARPFSGFGDMVGKMHAVIDEALHAFRPVTPRAAEAVDRRPRRGVGTLSDGSVTLAETVRNHRTTRSVVNAPVISGVTLTPTEFRAFGPQQGALGETWDIAEAVARKLSRITSSFAYQHAPQPSWVTEADIHAEVVAVQDGEARVRYDGAIASTDPRLRWENSARVRLTGEAIYDIRARQMQSVLIVGSGAHVTDEFPDAPVVFDVLIEWVREPRAASRVAVLKDAAPR